MDSLRQKLSERSSVQALAALSLETWLDKPLLALAPPELTVAVVREVITGWCNSPGALPAMQRLVEQVIDLLKATPRALKDVAPRDLREALRDVVGRPFSPDRRLVLTVIDREPTRELVRQLLLDFVLEFARKASAPVAGMAKGLGTFAKLAGEAVKSRAGTLGSIVGAVGGEVERQMEKRAVEFVDAALSGVFGQIADALSDPRRATEAAELRLAVLDGALELTLPQLARELTNADVTGGAEVVRGGLQRWLASAQSDEALLRLVRFTSDSTGNRPVRQVLEELGLLEVVRHRGTEALANRIEEVVSSAAFATWADQ